MIKVALPNGKYIEFEKVAVGPAIAAGLRFAAKPLARFVGGSMFRLGRTGKSLARFIPGAQRLAKGSEMLQGRGLGMLAQHGKTLRPTFTSSPYTIGAAGGGYYMHKKRKRKQAEK